MTEKKKKILVVDDEAHIREWYSHDLTEEGYKVATSGTAEGCLERIAKEQPDLVVLDIKLLGGSGLDLLQRIRHTYYDLPVILNTSYGVYSEEGEAMAADYYVIKSHDLTQLKEAIKKALEASPLKEEIYKKREILPS